MRLAAASAGSPPTTVVLLLESYRDGHDGLGWRWLALAVVPRLEHDAFLGRLFDQQPFWRRWSSSDYSPQTVQKDGTPCIVAINACGRERARLSATAAGEMIRDELLSSVCGRKSRGKRHFHQVGGAAGVSLPALLHC